MKEIANFSVKKFTYPTEEERNQHVSLLEKLGWVDIGRKRQLKGGHFLALSGADKDYEWCSELRRDHLVNNEG